MNEEGTYAAWTFGEYFKSCGTKTAKLRATHTAPRRDFAILSRAMLYIVLLAQRTFFTPCGCHTKERAANSGIHPIHALLGTSISTRLHFIASTVPDAYTREHSDRNTHKGYPWWPDLVIAHWADFHVICCTITAYNAFHGSKIHLTLATRVVLYTGLIFLMVLH